MTYVQPAKPHPSTLEGHVPPAQPGEDGERVSSCRLAAYPAACSRAGGGLPCERRRPAGLGAASKGPSISACVSPVPPAKPPGGAFSGPHVYPSTSAAGQKTCPSACVHASAQTLTTCETEGGLPGASLTVNPSGRQGLDSGVPVEVKGLCCPPCTGQRAVVTAVVSSAPTSPPGLEALRAARGPRPRRDWERPRGGSALADYSVGSGGGLFTDVGRTWQGPWGWPARGQSGRPEHRCPGPGPGALRNGRGRRLAPTCRTESLGPDSRRGSCPTALASRHREGSEGGCVCVCVTPRELPKQKGWSGLILRLVLRGSWPRPLTSTALCS